MRKFIFRVMVEVTQIKGTQLPEDCAGAIVNVFLGADNIRSAIDVAESELLNDCYRPVNTLEAYTLDLEEFDYDADEEGYPGNKELENLLKSGGVIYGPFNLFPVERNQIQ